VQWLNPHSNVPKPKSVYFGVVPKNCQPQDNRVAKLANLFDTHCHIDKIFSSIYKAEASEFFNPYSDRMKKVFSHNSNSKGPMEVLRKHFFKSHGDKFEGCINVFTNPKFFAKKHWEWMTIEKDVWFTLGCHPQFTGR
jgi:Tat protein secretion system quality control protein TatD with DNase activity